MIMGHYIIHFSPTGGTKKVADIIWSALDGEFNEIDLCSNIEQTSFGQDDICLVSVPSYGGRVPVTAIDATNPKAKDPEKCISCMRCISICPKGAIFKIRQQNHSAGGIGAT